MAGDHARRAVPFVGLTGGIAAGKSEALAALERLGAATLSSDAVVHEILTTDDARDELVARLGPDVAPGGKVDRDAVGALVFERPEERKWLEGYLWPKVGERIVSWRKELDAGDPPRAAVVEVPLLFESGMEAAFDHTIAVVAEDDLRSRRMEARGHTGVASRESRQLSQDEKAQRADFSVRNDGTIDELEEDLSRVLERMGA
jgi:dephospho-CoA kinase